MNKKTKLVLELLKPKVKSLGFNKEEVEGIAENIANNLAVDDDATDEAMNAAAAKAVEAVYPLLELNQKVANRTIQKNKEEREAAEAEARKKAEEEAAAKAAADAAAKAEEERKAKEEAERKAREDEIRRQAEENGLQKLLDSEWAKNMKQENEKLTKALKEQQDAARKAQDEFIAFRNEFNAMKAERVRESREKRLEALLEDTGVYGKRIRENYGMMTFNTDDDFEKFVSGVQEDIKAMNQERADKGLDKLGVPGTGNPPEPGKVEEMSDAEVDALAAIM